MISSPIKILILEDYPPDAELVDLELREARLEFVSERVETKYEFLEMLESSPRISYLLTIKCRSGLQLTL